MNGAADSLLRNDSLRRAVEDLFLQGAHFGPAEAADTLQTIAPPTTAVDLFGAGATLSVNATTLADAPPLTANPLFQCFVLALAVVYTLLICHHPSEIYTLFTRSPLDTTSGKRTIDAHSGSGQTQFLNFIGLTGLLLAGVLGVKCVDMLLPPQPLPFFAATGISLIAAAALLIIALMQVGALYLIGAVTYSSEFTGELIYLKRTIFAMMAVAVTPALLFFALSWDETGFIWAYIIIAEVIMALLIFLRRSFLLFMYKKISISHWFLYLCAIEIFPISLFWLLLVRE